jgi:hypothetical protein
MPLPNDATIEEVAEVFGVADRVGDLTPAARTLTKGQMLMLLGLDSEATAARLIAVGTFKRPPADTIERAALVAGLQLNISDIQSVRSIFGPARLPAGERQAIREAALSADLGVDPARLTIGDINIYCCCCPCCCATAVLDPVQPTVA